MNQNLLIFLILAAEVALVPVLLYGIVYLLNYFSVSKKDDNFSNRRDLAATAAKQAIQSLFLPFIATAKFFRWIGRKIWAINMTEFFQWAGGSNVEILRNHPAGVRKSRTQFGRVLLICNMLSGILIAHVVSKIFHSTLVGVSAGIFWAVFVWMYDRFYCQYIDRYGKDPNAKKVIFARKMMVFTFGFINASFVMLALFSTEINKTLVSRIETEKKIVLDSTNLAVDNLKAEKDVLDEALNEKTTAFVNWSASQEQAIAQKRQDLKDRQDSLVAEIQGYGGTKIRGYAEASRAKERALKADSVMLVEMQVRFDSSKYLSPAYLALQQEQKIHDQRTAEINVQIGEKNKLKDTRVAEIVNTANDGYVHQFTALFNVAFSSPVAFVLIAIIFLGFFYLEGFAVFAKAKKEEDSYQVELRLQEDQYTHEKLHDAQTKVAGDNVIFMRTMNKHHSEVLQALTEKELSAGTKVFALHNAQISRATEVSNHMLNLKTIIDTMPVEEEKRAEIWNKFIKDYTEKVVN